MSVSPVGVRAELTLELFELFLVKHRLREVKRGKDAHGVKFRAAPTAGAGGPLDFRPEFEGQHIPGEVLEARLALLNAEDAEKLRKELTGFRDPMARFLFFGGDAFGEDDKNVSACLTRCCAYVAGDVEGALRIFRASAWADLSMPEEELLAMAEEAVDFVREFRDTMAKMGRPGPGGFSTRCGYETHTKYGRRF